MALKNLTIKQNKIKEENLEELLSGFVLFDESKEEIILTPKSMRLTNREKILIFLIALKGWQFIISKNELIDRIKPKNLEKKLRIPGNSLRPMLLSLLKNNLIDKDENGYFIPDILINEIKKNLMKGGEKK